MSTLKTTFNNLVESMKRYDLYQKDDEVGQDLDNLSKVIDEVEKRMQCVTNTNKDIRDTIFNNQEKLDSAISYDDLEVIQRSINDIDIAIDLSDDEPIENNWYGLFREDKDVPRETLESTEDKVELSHGGIPYRVCYECSIKEEENVMTQVNGYWLCCDCNDEYKEVIKEDEPIFELDKTKFLPSTFDKVKQVIDMLKTIDNGSPIDGETMDHIVKELGFEEYLLRSLVMKSSFTDTKDLLREKFELSL